MQTYEPTLDQANELLSRGKPAEAAALLRPWLKQNPGSLLGWDLLGMAYFAQKDWAELEQATRATIQMAPDSPQAWSNWGMVLRKLHRPQDARDAQEHALSLDPDYRRPHVELRKLKAAPAVSAGAGETLFDELPPAVTPSDFSSPNTDDDLEILPYFDEVEEG